MLNLESLREGLHVQNSNSRDAQSESVVAPLLFNGFESSLVALPLLNRYGLYRTHTTSVGDKVTVLPTCGVPVSYLDRKNWARVLQLGNTRSVKLVDSLQDGTKPYMVVKSPERVFTTENRWLEKGYVWWGGPRSGEGCVKLVGNPVVEEQVVWEAIILLELDNLGMRVETPQAIIQQPNGSMEVVVKEITSTVFDGSSKSPTYNEILAQIRNKTSIVPVDASEYNCIRDGEGYAHVTDVNRWLWFPYTDSYRARLAEEIVAAIKRTTRVA